MGALSGITVLVTGAAGTVGTAVTQRFLDQGCHVRGLTRLKGWRLGAADVVNADLTDRDGLVDAARGADLAVHCAAAISSDLAECQRVNVDGTAHLIDALIVARCRRLVHISTLSVYADDAGPSYDEDSPLQSDPSDAYGSTKAAAEHLLLQAGARGLRSVVLRPGMVLSMHPRSRWGPLAFDRARRSPTTPLMPVPELPYVHAENLADAVVLAAGAARAAGRAYNAVDGVADTAAYLAVVYGGSGLPPPAVPPDAPRLRFQADRIRNELGWMPPDRWSEFLNALSRAPR